MKDWENDRSRIIENIQQKFLGKNLIVRSSSLEEDSWDDSQAGAFLSVADVTADDEEALEKAIEEVISGFRNNGSGSYNGDNQILVQPLYFGCCR
ncbi:MAG: hypothetical protein U5J95_12790 [Balneolaceae bacterium]|nr:hypothetical protein [Balneolaceae bacterium]